MFTKKFWQTKESPTAADGVGAVADTISPSQEEMLKKRLTQGKGLEVVQEKLQRRDKVREAHAISSDYKGKEQPKNDKMPMMQSRSQLGMILLILNNDQDPSFTILSTFVTQSPPSQSQPRKTPCFLHELQLHWCTNQLLILQFLLESFKSIRRSMSS